MQKVLIIGATSAIAEAVARRYAERGDVVCLAGRDTARLDVIAADLRVRGAPKVTCLPFDATRVDDVATAAERAWSELQGVDVALIAHGTLSDQAECQRSSAALRRDFEVNALSAMVLLGDLANRMEAQRRGTLAVISSVAGDRGRQSNYVYGAAKAAVTAFASGLRQRLAKAGVNVVTVKPGFVDTPMTAAFRKSALWAQPADVAAGIVAAIDRGRGTVYLPWFWRPIMRVIRELPEFVFKRLSL